MPSNDTENIYATQYGGEGEPIPATKISYNNTTSGLTADDIQEAVDEVALEAKGASQAITDITTELTGKYVKKQRNLDIITVTADGTKTVGELLNEASTAFKAVLSALEDNETVSPKVLFIGGLAWTGVTGTEYLTKNDSSFGFVFSRISYLSSKMQNWYIKFSSTDNVHEVYLGEYDSTGATITSKFSTVPTEGTKIQLHYETYIEL